MASNTYRSNTFRKPQKEEKARFRFSFSFFKDKRFKLSFGFFLLIASVFLLASFCSYLFTGKADQSVIETIKETGWLESGMEIKNWLGIYGAYSAHYFIYRWLGIAAFFIPPFLFIAGYRMVFGKSLLPLTTTFLFCTFFTIWISILLGYIVYTTENVTNWAFLGGGMGYHVAQLLHSLMGWGTFLFLGFTLLVFVIYFFNITSLLGLGSTAASDTAVPEVVPEPEPDDLFGPDDEPEAFSKEDENQDEDEEEFDTPEMELELAPPRKEPEPQEEEENPELIIEKVANEEKPVGQQENYDPTLDLSSYKYPGLDLLNEFDTGKAQVTKEELEQNKDKILETLRNFNIDINSIKATIGPTVTLYEIVPKAGIKISKIKNLEDDIALSLSALGIRIIAPIPGKGTIGIEVPNKNRETVGMKSVLSTERFMKSDKELPVALGKTISNEAYVVDLAKMPHILMAGATGQGKSVGLNVLLTSLLYKKHPSQLKFVLVDPKKVELTLFNKIERHFLAMLPDSEEAIITDTKKVVNTLNSLCIEMDNRYNLLKEAGARNLKEYNAKFVQRKLNPQKGHRFLPYIVLVIDELADLMMTAGKEVETPIARLAQLARAIGIHLVVATQRPSVNVITGLIKANFPARLSFRVTSKIDSRTILDTGGADQLVGMGDMLLSQGSDIIRLQCAFIDTPEVERICEFIGSQRGYETAYLLPEYVGEDEGGVGTVDLTDRDAMFADAARLVVMHQQGSTSLIQRKLKLGYNRAGRLIDQLEAAGIVGSFEGSKAREVLIQDESSLEQLLSEIDNKY